MGSRFSDNTVSLAICTTTVVAFVSGFMLGVYSIRGYLISPEMAETRRRFLADPLESDESEVEEDNSMLDHAPNWANGLEADQRDGLRARKEKKKTKKAKKAAAIQESVPDVIMEESEPTPTAPAGAPIVDNGEECKLVLVVRTDLGMTKGKIAAQCSHATLACYKSLSRAAQRNPSSPEAKLLKRWERYGQAKIAVQVKSQEEILALQKKARSLGLTAEVIQDAGRTQIEAGSLTVLGVGPAGRSLVDQVTGGLKLL